MWSFGLILLVVGLAGLALGLFLWRDIAPEGSMYRSRQDEEHSGCGLQLAVVAGLVIIVALIVLGYGAWTSLFSN
jgi:hypothetical protein